MAIALQEIGVSAERGRVLSFVFTKAQSPAMPRAKQHSSHDVQPANRRDGLGDCRFRVSPSSALHEPGHTVSTRQAEQSGQLLQRRRRVTPGQVGQHSMATVLAVVEPPDTYVLA